MSIELDPYARWDAAYVLGALTSDERLEFERHLTATAQVSQAVRCRSNSRRSSDVSAPST